MGCSLPPVLENLALGVAPPHSSSHLEELEIWKASGHPGQLVIIQVQLPQGGQKTQAPILNHTDLVVAQAQPVKG